MVSLKQKRQSGFTIVELLIVIVIIGILAGLVVTQILGATAKARDTERKTDIDQISNQLEAYYAKTGGYPTLADINASTWRTPNEFSAGDAAKSFADPSAPSNTSLTNTAVPTDVGAYYYQPGGTGCGSPTNSSTPPTAGTTTPYCSSYTLSAWLENDKKLYTRTNANQ